VVAVDSNGRPVGDLSSADFRVLDSNRPQQIVSFGHSDSRRQLRVPLGPHEFSNRMGPGVGHATVILFDLLNEHIDARGPAWNDLLHVLQPLESSDGLYFYLLTFEGRLYAIHGLPDPEKASGPDETVPWTQQIKPLLDTAINAVFRTRPIELDTNVDARVRVTYGALASLGTLLARFPGRKNIVWVTHGVPISLSPAVTVTDWIDYAPVLRRLSDALERANVSIYAVQQIPPGMASAGTPEARYSGMGSEDTLQEFARYTGGRANTSIRVAIQQAMNDVRTSYQIGYYPTPQNWDGKFHKIRVTCARKAVGVQTKEGYYAWPEEAFPEAEQRELLDATLAAPFDEMEIGISATLSQDDTNAGGVKLALRVDSADVVLVREGSRYTGHLNVVVAPLTADGARGNPPVVSVNLQLTPEQHDELMKNGILLVNRASLTTGIKKIRVVVLDCTSGAAGSLTIPVP